MRGVQVEPILQAHRGLGVGISAAVVLFGAAVYLFRHGLEHADYRVFHGEPADLRTLEGIIRATFSFRGRGIIQLGLVLLIATPVVRVAFAVVAFAIEQDRMYVVFTLIVLIILLFSLSGYI